MYIKQICAWVLRHPYSSSPSGQSKTISQRSSAGIQLLFMQRYSPVSHPVWGGMVPGTTLAHISSSELSRQSTSPSHCQLTGIHSNRSKHWKCSLWHVWGMEVTGPEHTQKQNGKPSFSSARDKNQKHCVFVPPTRHCLVKEMSSTAMSVHWSAPTSAWTITLNGDTFDRMTFA